MEDRDSLVRIPGPGQSPNSTPLRHHIRVPYGVSPAALNEAQWTKARCNRLLRPLSSRIALLRKHIQHHTTSPERSLTSNVGAEHTESLRHTSSISRWEDELRSKRGEQDPDWDPDEGPRKRPRRTYTTKRSMVVTERTASRVYHGGGLQGNVKIPSPLIGRISSDTNDMKSGVEASSPGDAWNNSKPQKSNSRDSFRRLAKSVTPSQWMLFDGLYSGLDSLLKATTKSKPPTRKGAMSLFSMCLRRIPYYIMEEQALVAEVDPDDNEDVAAAIYDDLESFGAVGTKGWKPLREVARSHGILMLGNAIRDGTIIPSIARGLVILCLHAHAFTEAEALLSSMLNTLQPLGRPTSLSQRLFGPETGTSLQTLKDVALKSGRWGFLFSSLSLLIRNNIVPIEWIACQDMDSCWAEAIKSIVQEVGPTHDASELLRTVISISYQNCWKDYSSIIHSYRLRCHSSTDYSDSRQANIIQALGSHEKSITAHHHDDKVRMATTSTILNLITVAFSANNGILETLGAGLCNIPKTKTGLYFLEGIAKDLLQHHEVAGWETSIIQHDYHSDVRSCMPALSFILLPTFSSKVGDIQDDASLYPLKRTLSANIDQKTIDALGTFICAIANCSARMQLESAFTYIQALTDRLLTTPASVIDVVPASRIAISAAFEFAENSSQKQHLDWALEIEDLISRDLASVAGPHTHGSATSGGASGNVTTSAGFRWEESIGEWVAKTPAPRKLQAKADRKKPLSRQASITSRHSGGSSGLNSPASIDVSESDIEEIPLPPGPTTALISEISPLLTTKRRPIVFNRFSILGRRLQSRPHKKRLRCSDLIGFCDDSDASSGSDFHESDNVERDRTPSSDSEDFNDPDPITHAFKNKTSSRSRTTEIEVRVPKLLWPRRSTEATTNSRPEVRVPASGLRKLARTTKNGQVEIRVPRRDELGDITNCVHRRNGMRLRSKEKLLAGSGGGRRKRREDGGAVLWGKDSSEDELGC